jgi:hypothetical protein
MMQKCGCVIKALCYHCRRAEGQLSGETAIALRPGENGRQYEVMQRGIQRGRQDIEHLYGVSQEPRLKGCHG